ncbi:hypothetical protein Goklo_028254 [Gossypium klotzschianum]|uniref:Uncharacterized protein n=1 Tax=Gossypium klotzschianum TaxID=34286 RepID=A0A7J8U0U2_9ROSI|nr:hypothetical protein [Gossypium klotzschianum]
MAMKLDSYLQFFLSSPAEAAVRKYQFDVDKSEECEQALPYKTNCHWEWWNLDVEILVNQANKLGLPPPTTDSGSTLPCSSKHTFSMEVEAGNSTLQRHPKHSSPSMPKLPAPNNTNIELRCNNCIRSLNSPQFQAKVPLKVNLHLFYTVGLGANLCSSCQNGTQLIASVTGLELLSRDPCGLRQSVRSKLA